MLLLSGLWHGLIQPDLLQPTVCSSFRIADMAGLADKSIGQRVAILSLAWICVSGLGLRPALSQQLKPIKTSSPAANSAASNPPATTPAISENQATPFLIRDPKQSSFTGQGAPAQSASATYPIDWDPLQPPAANSDRVAGLPMRIDSAAWEELQKSIDGLQKPDEEGDYVQAVFTLPAPSRSPNSPAGPASLPGAAGQASPFNPVDSQATQPADSKRSQLSEQASFLDSLKAEDFYQVATDRYRHYRSSEAKLTYLAASNSSFGWTSMEWEPYLKREHPNGLTGSVQHHFLSGPKNLDLPPRLHDLILGYQHRGTLGEWLSFDCAASIGVFTDFSGSVREGIRFPAHAVGIWHASHRADLVFGVDYLDRDDYKLLPVVGISWHDLNWTALRYDLIFPRPRIDFTINDSQRAYLAGYLGGGTWDFEYPNGTGSVMNYRDYRIVLGHEQRYLDGSRQSIELGYIFGRELTVRDVDAPLEFRNAIMLRMLSRY